MNEIPVHPDVYADLAKDGACRHFWSAWFIGPKGAERTCTYCGETERIARTL